MTKLDPTKYNCTTSLEEHLKIFAKNAQRYENAKKEQKIAYTKLVRDFIQLHYGHDLTYYQIANFFEKYTGKDMHFTTVQKAVKSRRGGEK